MVSKIKVQRYDRINFSRIPINLEMKSSKLKLNEHITQLSKRSFCVFLYSNHFFVLKWGNYER